MLGHGFKVEEGSRRENDEAQRCSGSSDSSVRALIDAGREGKCKMETDALLL